MKTLQFEKQTGLDCKGIDFAQAVIRFAVPATKLSGIKPATASMETLFCFARSKPQ